MQIITIVASSSPLTDKVLQNEYKRQKEYFCHNNFYRTENWIFVVLRFLTTNRSLFVITTYSLAYI